MTASQSEDETNSPAGRRRTWSAQEDQELRDLVQVLGPGSWSVIAAKLGGRKGKQCRERWHNHLRNNIKKGSWTPEEDSEIIRAVQNMGTRWSAITKLLPGRTDNDIKNRFNSTLRKNFRFDTTKRKSNGRLVRSRNTRRADTRARKLSGVERGQLVHRVSPAAVSVIGNASVPIIGNASSSSHVSGVPVQAQNHQVYYAVHKKVTPVTQATPLANVATTQSSSFQSQLSFETIKAETPPNAEGKSPAVPAAPQQQSMANSVPCAIARPQVRKARSSRIVESWNSPSQGGLHCKNAEKTEGTGSVAGVQDGDENEDIDIFISADDDADGALPFLWKQFEYFEGRRETLLTPVSDGDDDSCDEAFDLKANEVLSDRCSSSCSMAPSENMFGKLSPILDRCFMQQVVDSH